MFTSNDLFTAPNSDIRFGEGAYSRIRIKYWLSDSSIVKRTMLQPLKYLIFPHGATPPKTFPCPVEQQVFEGPSTSSVVISEMSTIQPAVGCPTREEMIENNFYAAPISIVAHIAQPRGFIHWVIQPELLPDPRSIAGPGQGNPLDGSAAAPAGAHRFTTHADFSLIFRQQYTV